MGCGLFTNETNKCCRERNEQGLQGVIYKEEHELTTQKEAEDG
ncbi:hypothetical protein E6C60_0064 [Paenibacillus algicola]|uniref:Uncharacterized protein n=1 Tax=Paenibacillus algicola TaxID=2565926 RepID=A0A4P8XEN5_9BACL|nr:hypothetical protein E6C60_0064 [Paenibacillus algicola]